jgi:hypothetical protein
MPEDPHQMSGFDLVIPDRLRSTLAVCRACSTLGEEQLEGIVWRRFRGNTIRVSHLKAAGNGYFPLPVATAPAVDPTE